MSFIKKEDFFNMLEMSDILAPVLCSVVCQMCFYRLKNKLVDAFKCVFCSNSICFGKSYPRPELKPELIQIVMNRKPKKRKLFN